MVVGPSSTPPGLFQPALFLPTLFPSTDSVTLYITSSLRLRAYRE